MHFNLGLISQRSNAIANKQKITPQQIAKLQVNTMKGTKKTKKVTLLFSSAAH